MAKQGGPFKSPWKNQKFNIDVQEAALKQSRMSGFRYTNNVLKALYGNLATSQAGLNRKLTNQQQRELDRVAKYRYNTEQRTSFQTRNARNVVSERFGSAVAGGTSFTALDAMGKAGIKAVRGQVNAAVQQAAGNSAAVQIGAQGVAAAQAGAEYATAQALLARTQEDAALIASERADLAKLRLQHELTMEEMKYQSALERKDYRFKLRLEQRLDEKEGTAGVARYTEDYTAAAAWMRDWMAEHVVYVDPATGEERQATMNDALTAYMNSHPVTTEEEQRVYSAIARMVGNSLNANNMTVDGYSRGDEAHSLATMLGEMYGLSEKRVKGLEETILSGLNNAYTNLGIDRAAASGAGGSGTEVPGGNQGPPPPEAYRERPEYGLSENPMARSNNLDIVAQWRRNGVPLAEAQRRLQEARITDWGALLKDAGYELFAGSAPAPGAGQGEAPPAPEYPELSDNRFNRGNNVDIVKRWLYNGVSASEAKRRLQAAGISDWGWVLVEAGYTVGS